MPAKEMLYALYQKLYDQRAVLTAAPQLTVEINEYSSDSFPESLADKECTNIISYLCGVADVNDISVNDVLRIVKRNYENQPFWKDVILDFLEYKLRQQQEEQYKQNVELLKESARVLNEIRQEENRRKTLTRAFGDKIREAGFCVDGYKLMTSYFVMYRKDAKKAYETLITNPAYFSPIQTTDSAGNIMLNPKEATEENAKLAKFLKGLKI